MTNVIGPDLSFYQDNDDTPRGVDFVKMRTQSPFVIVRAGQNTWPDPDFSRNWRESRDAGLLRGSYWFYDSRATPESQAGLWIDLHDGDFGELPLFADFEEKYGGPYAGWQNWKKFLEELKRLASPKEIAIYTAFFYWKDNAPNANTQAADLEYFHQYELWIANYGADAPAIPKPWGPNEWLFWQFTENGPGATYGAESSRIDLNYFNGDLSAFEARFGAIGPAPDPEPGPALGLLTHDGVTCFRVSRFGAFCVIHLIDTKKVEAYVTPGGFRTVGSAIEINHAQIGVNGGGWPNSQTASGRRSNELWASDGKIVQGPPALDGRPYVNISHDGTVTIHDNDRIQEPLWNAWGFDRRLDNGAGGFNTKISDRTTKDARTGTGETADGRLILLSASGNDRNQEGLSFPEMWEVLKEFGAVKAGNNDGGSSATVINTAISPDSLITTGETEQSLVINQVLFFAEPVADPDPDPTPPPNGGTTMDTYRIDEAVRPRSIASMQTTDTAANAARGTLFESDTVKQDIKNENGPMMVQAKTGPYFDKWFPLGNYNGTTYVRKVETAPGPAPEKKLVSAILTSEYDDGSQQTVELIPKP